MPRYSAPINSQRMNAPAVSIDPPGVLPLLAVTPVEVTSTEGATLSFTVTRTRNLGGTAVFRWELDTTGDFDDFPDDQPLVLDVSMEPDQVIATIQIRTVLRPGLQGDRLIILEISAISGCEIDAARKVATTELTDIDIDDPGWFKALPYTSGKAMAFGVSYFSDWRIYETECNEVDAFHGDHFGTSNVYIQTWDQVQGGPLGNPAAIQNNGQLGWMSNLTSFSKPFREVPVNTAWVYHNFTVVPFDLRTDSGVAGADRAIWDQIIAGTHDQRFREFGARIAALFAARGINLNYYIGCMCPKPQSADVYRIYASTKLLFKAACDRVYEQMRIGSGNPYLRFCFAPTHLRTYQGQDYGPLADWAPDTCDVIGVAFHPNSYCTTRARYDTLISGNANYYGVLGDVMALANLRGLPAALFEWSPRFETCPIANDVYGWFYDEFLIPNASKLVSANVFSEKTFDIDAADAQGTAAAAQWELGVNTFKTKWGDPGVVPEAVVRIEATTTLKIEEGNELTFNIKRNVSVTKACTVTWTATSSRSPADLAAPLSGIVAFSDTETTLSKAITVNTVKIAGDQGDRTITVRLSAPTTCSIDPTKSSATTVVKDFITSTMTTADLFLNPFNKDAAHHRPMGTGAFYQIQGSVAQNVGPPRTTGPASTYRANPGPVFKKGDLSPLVKAYAGLPHSGFFGELNAGGGGLQGIKHYYYVPSDPAKHKTLNIRLTKPNPDVNVPTEFPLKDYLGGLTEQALRWPPDPPKDGDNEYNLYPEGASADLDANFLFHNNFINGSLTSTTIQCTNQQKWPIDKLDYSVGNRAAGGSGVRFPTMFTRGHELLTSPPYIGHSLQMVMTRHNHANGDTPTSAIMLGDGNVWPTVSQDGGADDPDLPPGTIVRNPDGSVKFVLEFGSQDNSGFVPYGQLFVIPDWFYGARNSTTARPFTLPEYPGMSWALNLDAIGLAVFDALCDYGIRAVDGNGQGIGPGKAYGRCELRIDQECAFNTPLQAALDRALAAICPSITQGKPKWEHNMLFPVAGIRDYTGETERSSVDGLCYVGGGTRKRPFPNCVNTAYDA